jgi:hypothetical protein
MDRRTVLEVVGAAAGLVLAVLNVVATRRIWASQELERPQQVAQTILVWLLPCAFMAVRYELNPPREPNSDPTVPKIPDNTADAIGAGH